MGTLFLLLALWQVPGQPTVRDHPRELRQGHAILQPRYDKDEAAYKKIKKPSDEQVQAEKDMTACFNVAISTEGMYGIPAGKGIKPNCDRQFEVLEKLLP